MLLMNCACGQSTAHDAEPQFTGPYAAEFQKNYEETDNDLVKGILRDSQITDAEFEEFKTAYASCMESHGIQWQYLDGQGEQSSPIGQTDLSQETLRSASDDCSAQTGYMDIVPLYQSLHNNPDNLSQDELMKLTLACLQRHDLARQDMTFQEYKDIYGDNDRFTSEFGKYMDSSSPDSQRFYECQQHPATAD